MNLTNLFESTHQPFADLQIGDPVIITGAVEFRGKTGDVKSIGQDGAFVVVDLYNYGPQSFQASDVEYNDYADSEDELTEGTGGPSIQQLATISDEALDKAYGYGRSTPGNTFGWQANMMSASYAKKMIDSGVTDIEAIGDAIHKGWNVTAQKFVANPDQFSDTEKLRAAGKLDAKLQQRAQLMKQNYAQLPDEEKEKDRVVARVLLKALRGSQDVAEDTLDEAVGMKITDYATGGMDDQDFAAQIAAKTGGRVAYGGHGSYIVITYPTTQDRAMAAAKIRKMFPDIKLYKTGGNMNAIDEQSVAEGDAPVDFDWYRKQQQRQTQAKQKPGVAEGEANAGETLRSQIIKLYKRGLEDYDIAYDLDINEKIVADIIDDYDRKQQQRRAKQQGVAEVKSSDTNHKVNWMSNSASRAEHFDSAEAARAKVAALKQSGQYHNIKHTPPKGVAEASKEKTPGVALSKAYQKDFDGIKPVNRRPETALTGTYSKTGKPGGELKQRSVAEGAKEDMSKEVKAMATGTCPHCHGPVKKKEHPTLTQYHCAKCGIRASQDKPGVAEGNDDDVWGPQGRFAGDVPVNVGGAVSKRLDVGDVVSYFGEKATILAMSKDRTVSRIDLKSGITQNVKTSDLKRVGQGVAEAGSKNTEKTDQNWVDPALKRKMDYAFGHYAGYKDRPEAFFKWVMRSLEHSEHQDQEHSEQLQDLDQAISSIKKRLDSVLAQKNSRVAESRENKKQIIAHILKESRS
jgi:DNA-binding NarL/FixJ family response regulator